MNRGEHADTERYWDDITPPSDGFSDRTHTVVSMVLLAAGVTTVLVGLGVLFGIVGLSTLNGAVTAITVGGVSGLLTVFVPRWLVADGN